MTLPLDVSGYRSYTDTSEEDAVIESAIAVEASAQAKVCRIGDPYPPDLLEALKRRVMRNLSMRGQPAIVLRTENGVSFTPTNDPEVRRLESPYRKLPIG
jgi:hypothetical protein